MQSTSIEHEFDFDEETLWKAALFDEEYSRKLYLETLRFPRWRIQDQQITESRLTRRVEVHPRVDHMPAAVKKVVGDQLGYLEEGAFDRQTRRYTYRMIPNALADRTRIAGVMHTRARGPAGCVRIVDLEVECNVMLIGRTIEQRIIEDTRATHVQIATFTRNYLRDKAGASA
jgi:hypothetical protein